jgi:hypothetical protein
MFSERISMTLLVTYVWTIGVCSSRANAMMRTARTTNVFQNIFNAFLIAFVLLFVQLAKIVKISEKFRIFAPGYA